MHYHTQLNNDATQFSNDYYKTIELWSGWNLNSRWQILTFIPYQVNKQFTDDGIKEKQGIGDITLLTNYNVLHTAKKGIQQQLWIGGGLKLPTGRYSMDVTSPDANKGDVNSMSGTGSTDFLLNAMYNLSVKNYGINTSANYKLNGSNKNDYKFGDRFTVNSFAYYRLRVKGFAITPNVGLLYEKSNMNTTNKTKVADTGGKSIIIKLPLA